MVEAPPAVTRQRAADFAGCVVIDAPLTAASLLDGVREDLGAATGR